MRPAKTLRIRLRRDVMLLKYLRLRLLLYKFGDAPYVVRKKTNRGRYCQCTTVIKIQQQQQQQQQQPQKAILR